MSNCFILSFSYNNPTPPFQYKIAESPIPSAEEESSSEDEEDGPRKPKVDPDDPVARKSLIPKDKDEDKDEYVAH